MINKYINILKKSIIFLLIVLIIVSYSFGMTYSNFVYNSESHRAVEMFTSKLKYSVNINGQETTEYSLKPGNNLLRINIKSLNEIESYYKLAYKCDNVLVSYFEKEETNIIKSNENIQLNIVAFNKSNNNTLVTFDVFGGYITNGYKDVMVDGGFNEIKDNISIGTTIIVNNESYKLLGFSEDGSYELLSDFMIEKTLNGARGYNKAVSTLNNLNAPLSSVIYRSIRLNDIMKYTKNNLLENNSSNYYSDAYYPSLWAEEDSVINNVKNDHPLLREDEMDMIVNSKYSSSITVKGLKINSMDFINDKYKELFLGSNYLLATRYANAFEDHASWGVFALNDNSIELKELYDSLNNEYEVSGNIRVYAVIKSSENLVN